MSDRFAVIWTRTDQGPLKMANLVATAAETRFTYTREFLDAAPGGGVSLLAPPALIGDAPVVFQVRGGFRLYPRLQSMIPGEGHNNLQRKIYLNLLARHGTGPAPGFDTDWSLLMLTGRNGIGHLDLFPSDLEAQAWYKRETKARAVSASRGDFWQCLNEALHGAPGQVEARTLSKLIGPTPSAGGMIPKMLVSIPDRAEWDGGFAPSGTRRFNEQDYAEVVLKFEPPEYPGLLQLEALCLDVHEELGFQVPRRWLAEVDGIKMLAIERFDRDAQGLPVPMESFFSVFATGDRHFLETADTDMADLAWRVERLAEIANLDYRAIQLELYKRFTLALLTGNGDLHLENISFLGAGKICLAPVYDPAPMRAWPRHNIRMSVPLVFDRQLGGLRENWLALGAAFGLGDGQARDVVAALLGASGGYVERLMALDGVPVATREALAKLVMEERNEFRA